MPNQPYTLDAAMTIFFHIVDDWRRASDVDR